jgi:CxxC-x17-CxxC domain-containing protein
MYEDKTLLCRECGQEFVFSAGEQEFYQQKGLLNEPGRCPECRQRRRQGMQGQARGERAPREMHTITCAECGQEAQVPFIPRNDKPVYCSTCFERVRAQAQ